MCASSARRLLDGAASLPCSVLGLALELLGCSTSFGTRPAGCGSRFTLNAPGGLLHLSFGPLRSVTHGHPPFLRWADSYLLPIGTSLEALGPRKRPSRTFRS